MSSFSACVKSAAVALSLACLAGCASAGPVDEEPAGVAAEAIGGFQILESSRESVSGDIAHYSWVLELGNTPNAKIRVHRVVRERANGKPVRATHAVMLMHGDFANFVTNFAPAIDGLPAPAHGGLAIYLAEQGIDAWGIDRRYTLAPTDGADLSDFGAMTYAQEIDDIGQAFAFARLTRASTGSGHEQMILAGFSRGGSLAYEYVASESQRPRGLRHVSGLVPIDIYARIAPDDQGARDTACVGEFYERDALDQGVVDSDNSFQIAVGQLAASAPDDPSPFNPARTNRFVMLRFIGQTYVFYAPTPVYHLGGAVIEDGFPTALRYSPEPIVNSWLASSPFHSSLAEAADTDTLWCGDATPPIADHIADVDVPLYYLGAAGGFGDHGLYSTTLVASDDVTTNVIRRLDPADEEGDYGHGDLLYGTDSPALAWAPLAAWIDAH